jgi:hypothetical protein
MVMKVRLLRQLSSLAIAAAFAAAPLAVFAQSEQTMGGSGDNMMGAGQDHQGHTMGGGAMGGGQDDHQGHTMGGGMMGGGHGHMMGGGMMGGGQDDHQGHTMGGGMMGGGHGHMMGGGAMGGGQDDHQGHTMGGGAMGNAQEQMSQMMSMMRERLAHTGDRIASLKERLMITEEQTPAWEKFAGALLSAAKSMEQSMEAMQREMMQHAAPAPGTGLRDYPDFGAIKKTAEPEPAMEAFSALPAKLARLDKMLRQRLENLEAIKEALDPLYSSLSDEQKKIADRLKIGPTGMM